MKKQGAVRGPPSVIFDSTLLPPGSLLLRVAPLADAYFRTLSFLEWDS